MAALGPLSGCLLLLVACQMAVFANSAPMGDTTTTTTTMAPSDGPKSVNELEKKDGEDVPENVQEFLNGLVDREDEQLSASGRAKRSADYGYGSYGGYDDGYGGGSGGYGDSYGGYGGGNQHYGYQYGYNTGYKYGYPKTYYGKPSMVAFVKSFKPGKTYVEKGHVIRNYYIHGSYNVALQHYKYIPSLTVVPYTSYYKVPFGKKVQTKTGYKAYICKSCYHGYPKIDVYENKKPYNYVVRRFIYLPNQYNLGGYGHDSGSYGHESYGHDSYGHDSYGYGDNGGYGGNDYGYGSNSYGGYER